jgi:hypothetical protein
MERLGTYRSITALADLDDDGDSDVILGQTRWENEDTSFAKISIWLNQGSGQFTPGDQDLPGGFSAAGGDVDRDGDTDLLILDGYTMILSINQGGVQEGKAGVFRAVGAIHPLHEWRGHIDMGGSVTLADLYGDNAVDSFITGCCYGKTGESPLDSHSHIPSSSWAWINEWDSSDRQVEHVSLIKALEGLPIRAAALGDLDGDHDLDVFAAIGAPTLGESSSLADLVLLNDGAGNFTNSGLRLGETDSTSVALGDIDGDGDLDALTGTLSGAVVWINQGNTEMRETPEFALGQEINSNQTSTVFLKDFNSDSTLDALTGGLKQAVIWWNDGHGAFTRSNQRFRFTNRHGLAVEDFNGDGLFDIFVGSYSEEYTCWLNQGLGVFKESDRR